MLQAQTTDMKSRATSGDYIRHGSIGDSDCVVAFGFGYVKVGNNIGPGLSNQQMADHLNELYFRLPKILQFEVADALTSTAINVYRVERHRKLGVYLDTREVAEQAKEIMDRQGWKKAIIIAHPNHMPRADAVCQKLGIETVAPSGLGTIGFDANSVQEWTQNASAWSEQESKTIDYYADKDWI
jgi:hypothetical protein